MTAYNVCNKKNDLWISQYIEIPQGSYFNINGRLYHVNFDGETDPDLRMDLIEHVPAFKISPRTKTFILPRSGQYKQRKMDVGLDTCVSYDKYNSDFYTLHVNQTVQARILHTKVEYETLIHSTVSMSDLDFPEEDFEVQGFTDQFYSLFGLNGSFTKTVGDTAKLVDLSTTILEHKDDVMLLANTLDAASRAKQVVKEWFLRIKKWFDDTMVTVKDHFLAWAGALCTLVRSLVQHAKISLRKLYNFLRQLCGLSGVPEDGLVKIKEVIDKDEERAKEVLARVKDHKIDEVTIDSDDELELQSGNDWVKEMGGDIIGLSTAIVVPLLGLAATFGLIPMAKGIDKLSVFMDKFCSGRFTLDPFQKFFNVVYHWITGENYYVKFELRSQFNTLLAQCHGEIDDIKNLVNPPLVSQKKIADCLREIDSVYAMLVMEFPKDAQYLKTLFDNVNRRGSPWRCTFEGAKRMKPISIAISGQAGCGKTLTQDFLIDHVMKVVGSLSSHDGPVMDVVRKHAMAPSSLVMSCLGAKPEYDDGYQDPLFYVFNEYLTSKNLEVCEEWSQHFMKCMDDQPYMLNMAFGEKGNKYFHSPFIIATGNYDRHYVNLKDPMAYHRRLHLDVVASPAGKRGENEPFDVMKHVKYKLTQKCLDVSMSNIAPSPVIRMLSKDKDGVGFDFSGHFNFRTLVVIVVCMYLERIMTYRAKELGVDHISKLWDISDFSEVNMAAFYMNISRCSSGLIPPPNLDDCDVFITKLCPEDKGMLKDMFNLFLHRIKGARELSLKPLELELPPRSNYEVQGRRVRRQQKLEILRRNHLPIVVNYSKERSIDYFMWRDTLFENVFRASSCDSSPMPYDFVDVKGNAKRIIACFSDSLLSSTLYDQREIREHEASNIWIAYARLQFEIMATRNMYDVANGNVKNIIGKDWRDFRKRCVRIITLCKTIVDAQVGDIAIQVALAFPYMSFLQRKTCSKAYERVHRLDKNYNARTLDVATGKPTHFSQLQVTKYNLRQERNILRRKQQAERRKLRKQQEPKQNNFVVTVDKKDYDNNMRYMRDMKFADDDWDKDDRYDGKVYDWDNDMVVQSGNLELSNVIMSCVPDESDITVGHMKFKDWHDFPFVKKILKSLPDVQVEQLFFVGYNRMEDHVKCFARFAWWICIQNNEVILRRKISDKKIADAFTKACDGRNFFECVVMFSRLFGCDYLSTDVKWQGVIDVLNGGSIVHNCESHAIEFMFAYAEFVMFEENIAQTYLNKCQGDLGKQFVDFFYNYGMNMLIATLGALALGSLAFNVYQYFNQSKQDKLIEGISEFQKMMDKAGMPVDIVPQGYHHNREKIVKNNVVNRLGKKLVLQGGGVSSGVFDVIQSNQYAIVSMFGSLMASATFLCGRVAMMNKHVYETLDSFMLIPYAAKAVSVVGYKMDKSELRVVEELKGSDTILVVVPKVRMHANIVKHFVREDEMILASYATTGLISCYSVEVVAKDACPIGSVRFSNRAMKPITFPGREGVNLSRRMLYHWPGAVSGACGAVPILPVGGNLRMMGAHTAGSTTTQDGVSSIITYEMLACLQLENYMNLPGATIADTISVENKDDILGSYEFTVQNGWETPVHTNATDFTTFVPTQFQELGFEGGSKRVPAVMDNEAYQKGLAKEAALDGVINYDKRCPLWTLEYFDTILETYLGTDAKVIRGCRTLTMDESLFGYKRLEKFDPKTSKGIRLRMLNLDKRKILAKIEPDYSKYREFHDKRDKLRLESDIFQAQINYDKEKDECRDQERVDAKKTRIFKITDFDDNVHIKRALGDLVERTKSLHWLGAQSCGIDPTSSGWRDLAQKFERLLVNFSDIAGFESTLTDFVLPFIIKLCSIAYSDPREARYAVYAVMSCLYALRFNRGKGFCLGRGNTSGNWITTWLNTIVNMLYFACVVIKGALENNIDPNIALRELIIKLYSDDNLTHLPYPWYTPKFIELTFKELFGIIVTGTDKGAVTDDGIGFIETADFLSRAFRRERGQWCCPLAYDQLMTQLYFVRVPKRLRGNTEFLSHQLQLNLDNVMRELNEYPRVEAISTVKRIRSFIVENRLPLVLNFDFSDHAEIKLLRQ